jgi:hypothetical protein
MKDYARWFNSHTRTAAKNRAFVRATVLLAGWCAAPFLLAPVLRRGSRVLREFAFRLPCRFAAVWLTCRCPLLFMLTKDEARNGWAGLAAGRRVSRVIPERIRILRTREGQEGGVGGP